MRDGKVDPRPIIADHFRTLVDARTGRARAEDYLTLFGGPLALAVLVAGFDVRFGQTLAVGLLTVAGVAGAFLFQLAVQLVDTVSNWADAHPDPGPRTSRRALLLGQMMANAAYASLLSLLSAAVLVVVAVARGDWLRLLSAGATFLLVHLLLTLAMVLRRMFLYARDRLDTAKTGAERFDRTA